MENAILIAKIASIVYLSIAVGTFLSPSLMKKILDDFVKGPGLTFLAAWMTTVISMLIILSYNVWARHRGLLVTIFGWIGLIKGISFFIMPQNFIKMSSALVKKSWRITTFTFVLWLLFFYLGFLK